MPFHSLGAWGLVLGAVGVLTLVGVVISGLAAPNPLFSIFTLAGLLLCGLGILLMAVQWLRELIRALRSHNYRQVLLLLLGAIIARCIWVARRACSPQSAFIAMGYAGMLLAQVGVNVGMCLYVFPVVGLTLPFISYGGTSIVTMFAAMGIISSIKMRSLPSWLRDRSRI